MAMIAIGRRVYGLGALALGIPGLIFADFAAMGLPVPAGTPGYHALAYASAAVLVLAGLAINVRRTAPMAALGLTAFFALFLLVLHLPNAVAKWDVWVSWEAVAETTVMALGGLLAFALSSGGPRAAASARLAPRLFGLCLVVFGISEFVYAKFTASLVPAWLPPSQLAWTYVTGAAQIAAGLAIASGIKARLAAILLTAMYVGFGLLVHLPRLIADPANPGVLGEHGVNLVLAGAAWCLADALAAAKGRTR